LTARDDRRLQRRVGCVTAHLKTHEFEQRRPTLTPSSPQAVPAGQAYLTSSAASPQAVSYVSPFVSIDLTVLHHQASYSSAYLVAFVVGKVIGRL